MGTVLFYGVEAGERMAVPWHRVAAPLKPLNQPVEAAATQFRHHEPDEALQAGRHDGRRDRLHENGTWHDGAIFLLGTITDRVTAIFLGPRTR